MKAIIIQYLLTSENKNLLEVCPTATICAFEKQCPPLWAQRHNGRKQCKANQSESCLKVTVQECLPSKKKFRKLRLVCKRRRIDLCCLFILFPNTNHVIILRRIGPLFCSLKRTHASMNMSPCAL